MKKNNIKGAALASVLIVLTFLSILGLAILNVSLSENKFAIHQEDKIKAYYIARGGAEAAATWIADKNHNINTIETLVVNNQINDDVWTEFGGGKFKISFPGGNKYTPTIKSVGTYNGVQSALSISLNKKYFFDATVTALDKLDIENYSNCTIDGDVALGDSATITPPNGSHTIADVITGSITTTDRVYPPIQDPNLPFTMWTDTNTISSGDIYADHSLGSVNINSSTLDINLSGNMELQFDTFIGNNATINVNGTGNLTIYVNTVDFKGNLFTSNTATTTIMVFDSGEINFQTGSSTFQSFIYAPNAKIKVSSNFGSVGAIIAQEVVLSSGGYIKYDKESLGNVYPEELGFPSEGYDRNIWSE